MTKADHYTVCEPEEVTAYRDQKGVYHETRDAALKANVIHDYQKAITEVIEADPRLHDESWVPLHNLVMDFVSDNPGLLRVILGDKEPE